MTSIAGLHTAEQITRQNQEHGQSRRESSAQQLSRESVCNELDRMSWKAQRKQVRNTPKRNEANKCSEHLSMQPWSTAEIKN